MSENQKTLRILSTFGLILYALCLQVVISINFPDPGLDVYFTGLINATVIVSVCFFNYSFIQNLQKSWKSFSLILIELMIISVFLVAFYGNEQPSRQLITAYQISTNKDVVTYDDLFRSNKYTDGIYLAAALAKYQDSIPEIAWEISYEGPFSSKVKKSFYLAKIGDQFISNNKELTIRQNEQHELVSISELYDNTQIVVNGKDVYRLPYMRQGIIADSYLVVIRTHDFTLRKGFSSWFYKQMRE